MAEFIENLERDASQKFAIATVDSGGTKFYESVYPFVRRPYVVVWKKGGVSRPIEKRRYLVCEDVVSESSSVRKVVDVIRAYGGLVNEAVTLLDRLLGGRENLQRADVKLYSILTKNEIRKLLPTDEFYKKVL